MAWTPNCLLYIVFLFSKKESIPKELLEAFKAMYSQRRGSIPARDLWNILVKWGEKLSPREGDDHRLFISSYLTIESLAVPVLGSLHYTNQHLTLATDLSQYFLRTLWGLKT